MTTDILSCLSIYSEPLDRSSSLHHVDCFCVPARVFSYLPTCACFDLLKFISMIVF